jgi:hypothetical protein
LRRYRRRANQIVVAVQLDLKTSGFTYQKWGGSQQCKAGDYLVDNESDIYTVDREVFERTYRQVARGQYVKTTPVWATATERAGSVNTKEGVTHYQAHDYLVSNDELGNDSYAVTREKFEAMYEPDDA